VAGVGVLLAAGTTTLTVKEIRGHHPYPWQVRNADSGMLDRVPPQVKIVPTIFPPGNEYTGNNGRMLGMGLPIPFLLGPAYDTSKYRMIFNTQLPEGNYDFIANLPKGNPEALRHEIERQFHLVGRTETRETDVLLFTVKTRNAPGLRKSAAPSSRGSNVNNGPGHYKGDNTPLSYFAGFLEYHFEIPVIDRTGMADRFDFDLKWDELDWQHRNPEALKQVLLDQLGLKLVPSRESIEMLVVERVKD
jgi:uncharacterized protein (TIGR03435 family)